MVIVTSAAACRALPDGWAYVTRVEATRATVAWTGAAHLSCRDRDGRELGADVVSGRRGLHSAQLEGLSPATSYACRLGAEHGRGQRVRFRTAPAAPARVRFAVVGDSGDGSPQAALLARRIRAGRPDFLIHLGDMAYQNGTVRDFGARFFRPYRQSLARMPLFPAPGNHDLTRRGIYDALFAPVYAREGPGRFYSFDWAGVHLVSLSSMELTSPDGAAARRLGADLAAAPAAAWRIVFLHHPPYSLGVKKVPAGFRKALRPLLETGQVQLVLAGHEHLYERRVPVCGSDGKPSVLPIISGGGGRNLDSATANASFPHVVSVTHYLRVTVTPRWIDVRAVDLRGHTIDRVRRFRDAAGPCKPAGG